MKTPSSIYIIAILAFTANICRAQTTSLKPVPVNVVVDGNAAEWGKLPYSNDKAKITYTLANDKNNIYLVVKTKDTLIQSDILGSGITFSINTKGKKTTTYWTDFPVRGKEDPSDYQNLNATQMQAKAALTKYGKVEVKGFADITDKQLSPANVYGIQVAIGCDDAGYLVYEEAIPLTLFHADIAKAEEWAFNICINGLKRNVKQTTTAVYRNSRMSSVGIGNSDVDARANVNNMQALGYIPKVVVIDNDPPGIQLTPSVDFWVKYALVKTP